MELLLFLTIHAIGLSALAAIRIGRSELNIRSRQIFFFASILLVAVATMVTTALSDPMWVAYAGLFSVMLIGGVVDFSIGSHRAELV